MSVSGKRCLILLGSPRAGGNSDGIAEYFGKELRTAGAFVEIVALRELHFSGCRNLFHCKTLSERCGLADAFSPVLEAVREADILVLASPVYFTGLTSDLHAAIERFFSFLRPDYPNLDDKSRLPPGKKLLLIQTQGEGAEYYGDLLARYEKSFRMLGFDGFFSLRAAGVRELTDLDTHKPRLEQEIETLLTRL